MTMRHNGFMSPQLLRCQTELFVSLFFKVWKNTRRRTYTVEKYEENAYADLFGFLFYIFSFLYHPPTPVLKMFCKWMNE